MSKVKCTLKINSKESLNEMPNAWTNEDYKNIMDEMGFSDEVENAEIQEMAMMVISDNEPEESAQILLQYRLSEKLTEGQIKQLSHEMQEDKVSEEYPDIFLQKDFFNINQLLFKSFNGKFPNCHAVKVELEMAINQKEVMESEQVDEVILKSILPSLGDHSLLARLYEDELKGTKEFTDAAGIIWEKNIETLADGKFKIQFLTSEYWMQDLPSHSDEFDSTFEVFEKEEEEPV